MRHGEPEKPQPATEADIEAAMRKTSLVVSIIALALMVGGRAQIAFFGGMSGEIATYSVVPLSQLVHPSSHPLGLVAVSVGVVLLCLLPAVRVVLALWTYVRQKFLVDALIALLVLVELFLGMKT
jgi:uncharacterized membrane protein